MGLQVQLEPDDHKFIKEAKGWWAETKKQFVWILVSLVTGGFVGGYLEQNRLYNDCRYAGVTRIGTAAFKCDQFSKVVLLTPDEQAKKEVKK